MRRDTGERYEEFLKSLAEASGIETPRREDLAKVDRKRPKKGSNEEWRHPEDPDARITKMKDGRTHLAHKAEHAVDAHGYDTGAMRRTHLRHHGNIRKRPLVHLAGFNLSLVLRRQLGVGKPRALQGAVSALRELLVRARAALEVVLERLGPQIGLLRAATHHSSPAAGA